MARALNSINEAAGVLNSGGILLLQTDTLPGLHGRADDSLACAGIQKLKGRGEKKPMVVLAANLEQVRMVCGSLSQKQEEILDAHWPGPFSFILPAGDRVCVQVTGGSGTVAVRIPNLEGLRSVINAVGYPLASTSANLAGELPCAGLAEAVALFSGQVKHHWIDESWNESMSGVQPSALIDLTVSPANQLRPGPLPYSEP